MTRGLRAGITGLWIVIASGLLVRWWYAHPEMFPRLPQTFWDWVDGFYGAATYEGKTDVELLVVLGSSLILVSAVTLLLWVVYRVLRKG